MFKKNGIKYNKSIAWFFFFLLYLQTALPVIIHATPMFTPYRTQSLKTNFSLLNPTINPDTENSFERTSDDSHSKNISKKFRKKNDNTDHKFGVANTDIGGPGQPEMQSFQSVSTSNMVDLFTGDFSYNIPLLDVGGYPVNIHYTSGVSMDQEASWVGLGWNINPGTISRNMRGIPDDFNGQDSIARTQHTKANKTAGLTLGGDIELFGGPLNVGASIGIFYNNYNGWGIENGINASINSGSKGNGALTGGLSITNNSQTGLNVNPSLSVSLGGQDQALNGRASLSTNFNSRTGISALQLNTEVRGNQEFNKTISNAFHSQQGSFPLTASLSFAVPSYTPTICMPYTSSQYAFTVKLGGELWGSHVSAYLNGYVSKQEIKSGDQRQSLPAFGYLYYSRANHQPNALLDINREKESYFNYNSSPMIAIPQYTYDIYSISGEGIGGTFRPYRGDIGYARDHEMRTKSSDYNGSIDLGFGGYFHIGADFIPTKSNTQTHGWEDGSTSSINKYVAFQQSDSNFQEVYFRNPGEKTSNSQAYYRSVGDDTLMRVQLGGNATNVQAQNVFTLLSKKSKPISTINLSSPIVKKQRDKRTQVIDYLTASETVKYGLDKTIKSYKENTIPLGNCSDTFTLIPRIDNVIRKKHHLSEIDVTNAD